MFTIQCVVQPELIVQAKKYWLVRFWLVKAYIVQPAMNFKPMNVGSHKHINFGAKLHKPSLDICWLA